MKPYHLKIAAFGPFAKTVDLNFKEDLQNDKIFVITGPTGAGKTTIFDAICYALYGESSGASRKGDQLRSDFSASLDLLTSVELTFGIRHKVYTIKRQPKQMAPKKRGEGYREYNSAVELLEHDCDRPPLTKEGDVKQEISQILGLTVDQFRKIVMIPQGDFKEFLIASTTSKEELLRKIFGTHIYKNIQEKLADTATELKEKVATNHQEIQSMLKTLVLPQQLPSAIPEILATLERETTHFESEKTSHASDLEMTKKQYLTLQENIANGQSLNQKFQEKAQLETEVAHLHAQTPDIENLKKEVQQIRQASLITVLENNKTRTATAYKKIITSESEEKQRLESLKQALFSLQSQYEKIPEEELKIKAFIEQESQLSSWLKEMTRLEDAQNQLAKQRSKEQALKNQIGELSTQIRTVENSTELLEQKRIEQLQLDNTLTGLISKAEELTEQVQKSQEKLKDFAHWQQACAKTKQLAETYETHHAHAQTSQQIYEQKANQFIHATAARLAIELEVGNPCPVCGSLEHPNPAATSEASLSKEELEQYKANYDDAAALEKQTLEKLSQAQLTETAFKQDFTQHSKTDLQNTLQHEKNSLESLKTAITKETQNKEALATSIGEMEAKKKNLQQWQLQAEQLNQELVAIQISVLATEQSLAAAYSQIPESYQKLEPLQQELRQLENDRQQSERHILATRQKYEQTLNALRTQEGTLSSLANQKATAFEELNRAEAEFNSEWAKHFENLEAYRQVVNKLGSLADLEHQIQNFATQFHSAKQRLKKLAQDLSGKTITDLAPLQQQLQELDIKKDALTAAILQLEHQIKQFRQVFQFVSARYEKIKHQEDEYAIIGELSELANGKTAGKMTFETYVLSGYFDVVLSAANIRLQKMTANRYHLLRREEVKGGGRKGLELDVYDSHTCKSRPINTLSGGESFKASLALALGLSDTVQQTTGGIELNTMFIDEGFGTLDPHSLEQAVDILMDLQEHGRLIGVISHVAELKDRIPAKLVVTTGPAGSVASFQS